MTQNCCKGVGCYTILNKRSTCCALVGNDTDGYLEGYCHKCCKVCIERKGVEEKAPALTKEQQEFLKNFIEDGMRQLNRIKVMTSLSSECTCCKVHRNNHGGVR